MQVVQGSCPAASSLGQAQCSGRVSDCWSVGQADADCINNALCCFDGCAYVCQGAGNNAYPFYQAILILLTGPRTPARPSNGVQVLPYYKYNLESHPYDLVPGS